MKLTPEFRELLSQFNAFDVEYMVVGGYALAYHGHPRATKDIDIFISTNPLNAQKVRSALQAFGFESNEVSLEDLQDSGTVIRFGAPPNMVDVLKSIDGVVFDEAFGSSETAIAENLPVRVISREFLIQNKRSSGRYQDLADLEALGEIGPREK